MILADHCVYGSTLRLLQEAGYAVIRSKEFVPADACDADVLRAAVDHDFVLLTNDRDFSNVLRYKPAEHAGIIVLRMAAGNEKAVHDVLLQLLRNHDRDALRQRLAVVDASKYRLRG